MSKNTPTLRDVAKFAGVAVGTVSNYINNPETVKYKNRIAISDAIAKLNFIPNTMAQRLAKGESNTILLYIISENEIGSSTWLHQLPIIQAINDHLKETKYALQINIGRVVEPEEIHRQINEYIMSKTIDGVAILSAWEVSKDILMTFLRFDFPFVLIENENTLTYSNDIFFDNQKMTKDIVDYLVDQGHSKIGFIGVDSRQQHIQKRLLGYREGLKKHNLSIYSHWIMQGDFTIESGYQCVSRLLSHPEVPTAIVGGNDNMAAGAVAAIVEKGYRVPQDISIIGIDDSIVAKACIPKLTTMEIPSVEVGKTAISQLLTRIERGCEDIPQTIYGCTLIERDSVTSPKNSVFL